MTAALVLGSATLIAPAVGAAPAASACVPLATPEFDGTLAALTDPTGIDTFEQA